jgi:uncharacterized protein DUF1706
MHKPELLAAMRAERARWDALVAKVGASRVDEPGVAGDWTLKDVSAHLTRYEAWTAAQLAGTRYETAAPPPGVDPNDMQQRNAWFHDLDRSLPWEVVLPASAAAHAELLRQVEARDDADLQAPYTLSPDGQLVPATDASAQSAPLWQIIDGNAAEHYRDHADELEAWLAKTDLG